MLVAQDLANSRMYFLMSSGLRMSPATMLPKVHPVSPGVPEFNQVKIWKTHVAVFDADLPLLTQQNGDCRHRFRRTCEKYDAKLYRVAQA